MTFKYMENEKSKSSLSSLRGLVYAALFGAGTAVGAFIMVPIPPVPITLQTLFLYLAAIMLGARLATLSQVVYITIGIIGLPVFAGGKAGLGVLFGPTGGYLVGFIPAAYIIGKWNEMLKKPSLIQAALSMVAGTLIIYLFGVFQLSLVAKLGLGKAVAVGALPFLIGDGVKIVAATLISRKLGEYIRV